MHGPPYLRRVLDDELDELLPGLPAIALEGAKGVGKTASATRRARTVHRFDDPARRAVFEADPDLLLRGEHPIFIDEWQLFPSAWDLVRRAVDEDRQPGRFLIAGSATPRSRTHSGAGRIVRLRVRPMTLFERGVGSPAVSLRGLLTGRRPPLAGASTVSLADYARLICESGLPGLQGLGDRFLRAQLDSYIDQILDRDLPDMTGAVRRPETLRKWLAAYAAATSTVTSYEAIREAATPGEHDKPTAETARTFREALERLWILDPVPGWLPTRAHLRRLGTAPKLHLFDPGLAARLLGAGADALLEGDPARSSRLRDPTLLGQLFESLVTLDVRVFAQAAEARTLHLRTHGGEHEVDLIVERSDHRVLAIEVKMTAAPDDRDVRHLQWLAGQIGPDLLDSLVVTTGSQAYRRRDGIGVVPAALLGP